MNFYKTIVFYKYLNKLEFVRVIFIELKGGLTR